jgi:3-isopropylmalate/(R)-2-methylmalate dehydratase small subunit
MTLDLGTKTLTCGELEFPFDLPESFRRAMTEGLWDSTSLLLSNIKKVKETAGRLPYLSGSGR